MTSETDSSAAKVYVTIPSTVASHVHGPSNTELSHGDLNLVRLTHHTLGLTIGSAAFSLDRTTPFGTLAENCYTYVFQPSGVTGHVRLTIPDPELDNTIVELQNIFERILIRFGLLKSGISAFTDEITRSAEESSLNASTSITSYADIYVSSHPATSKPVKFGEDVHEIVASVKDKLSDAADTTGSAAEWVGGHVEEGGAWAAQNAGGRPAIVRAGTTNTSLSEEKPASLTLRSAATEYVTLASALTSSASALTSAAGSTASRMIGHDFGPDAQKLSQNVFSGIAQVGQIVGDVGKATSVGWFAGHGAMGALDVKDPQVARQVRKEGRGMELKKEAETQLDSNL